MSRSNRGALRARNYAWFPSEIPRYPIPLEEQREEVRVGPLYHNLVGYLVQELWDQESDSFALEPIGTLFFVEYPGDGSTPVSQAKCYAVTCRHVIEGALHYASTGLSRRVFIRLNRESGIGMDFPTSLADWSLSDTGDVAAIPFELPNDRIHWGYPVARIGSGMMDGQDVFCVGMFAPAPGALGVQAIVRTGTLARVTCVAPLVVAPSSGASIRSVVHLIEMHSWGGESGSPVFIYDQRLTQETQHLYNPGYGAGYQGRPDLLGMLHGQFPISRPVYKKNKNVGVVELNSGIGAVIPKGQIQLLLRKMCGEIL